MVVAHKGDHVETFAADVRKMNIQERERFARLMRTDGDTLAGVSHAALHGKGKAKLLARLNLGLVMVRRGPRHG